MRRFALILLLTLVSAAPGTPEAADDPTEVRIPHLDGSGTETIVTVPSSIPGARTFVRATPGVIPRPGQLILPPSPSATPASAPTPEPTRNE